MIEKVRIRGYRKFRDITVVPNEGINILVGDNESGKSTIIEAIGMALTGRVNNRPASDELNPYWFNRDLVEEFFAARAAGNATDLPAISIEVFFRDEDELQRLVGAHNSDSPLRDCPGVEIAIGPDPDYLDELDAYLDSGTSQILPVEFYCLKWRTFADNAIVAKPRELSVVLIDARTIRSTSAIDYHLRQMLSDHLEAKEKAEISVAYRGVKEKMTTDHLAEVNKKMEKLGGAIDGQKLGIAMDQSSRTSWDSSITPHVSDLPFALAGLGQQVAVKIALAMHKSAAASRVVMIEEPENHLSHTSLNKLIDKVDQLRGNNQQLIASTHSSFVLNRLGLDSLLLLCGQGVMKFDDLDAETVGYFRKLPGYDTLRLVLADRIVLVEGPSDEIVFERFYQDKYGRRPIADGIDVVSMRGLSLKRCLKLAKRLDKRCAGLRDNDDTQPDELRDRLKDYLDGKRRELFVGPVADGSTLEPQIISANDPTVLRGVLGLAGTTDLKVWMRNNKTEAAIRIADSATSLTAPEYMAKAIEFIHSC